MWHHLHNEFSALGVAPLPLNSSGDGWRHHFNRAGPRIALGSPLPQQILATAIQFGLCQVRFHCQFLTLEVFLPNIQRMRVTSLNQNAQRAFPPQFYFFFKNPVSPQPGPCTKWHEANMEETTKSIFGMLSLQT